MTLNKFIKRLQSLADSGHGLDKVCVNRDTLFDGNGSWSVCDVASADSEFVRVVDVDGFGVINKDGSERARRCIVITGDYE